MIPSVVELFAGAGGAALGLSRAGWHHLALCEWDAAACATLRAAGHDHVLEGDLRDIDWSSWPSPELLWASPPCQAWSSAGKREGARDERNGWPWTWDAVDALQPDWFVAENVPGLLHHLQTCGDPDTCSGCYWERVILPAARERWAWVGVWLLNAADYGVPQHRRRVFLVAGPGPVAAPPPTHADPAELRQGSLFEARLPWRTAGEALGIALAGIPTAHAPGERVSERGLVELSERPAWTVPADVGRTRGGAMVALLDAQNDDTFSLDRPSRTIRAAQERGGRAGLYAICAAGVTGEGRPQGIDGPAPTLGAASSPCLAAPDLSRSRRLTPEECAALQGFPPDYPFQGGQGARYRQIGNAVPPPLAEAVGRALRGAL